MKTFVYEKKIRKWANKNVLKIIREGVQKLFQGLPFSKSKNVFFDQVKRRSVNNLAELITESNNREEQIKNLLDNNKNRK